MKTVIVFLADGFEECEGLLTVDLLRRVDVNVITASVMGRTEILSSHGIRLQADVLAEDAPYDQADMVMLPGGGVGTQNLSESAIVREKCLDFADGKLVAAICAAPSILASLGLLEGKQATCHPSVEDKMAGAKLTCGSVVTDGNITTGQGLGAGIPFALELVRILAGQETADRIAGAICWR